MPFQADYTAEFFIDKVAGFLRHLGIEEAVLVGESIGATAALGLAARRDPRVRAVVAISTYDYDRGRGTRRASALARLIFSLNDVPVLGGTVARLRQYSIVKAVFDGATTGRSWRWSIIGRHGRRSGNDPAASIARSCYSMVATTGPAPTSGRRPRGLIPGPLGPHRGFSS